MTHSKKYPLMEIADAVKLIYQNEFGGGHMIMDEKASLEFLKKEYAEINSHEEIDQSAFEPIGNGLVRLDLKKTTVPLHHINKMFVLSSKTVSGTVEGFEKKLDILRESVIDGMFSFSIDALDKYLADYKGKSYPMVSHSETYRNAYDPHYRIMDYKFLNLLPVIDQIDSLLKEQKNIIVGIDGFAGAGKSFAGNVLSEIFDGSLIHMDDFFLPAHLRSNERYEEAGGNIHYERFIAEVYNGLKSKKEFTYRKFDCSIMDYTYDISIFPKRVTLIEGSYAIHPKFPSDLYDFKVFLSVDSNEQIKRLSEREGKEGVQAFIEKWIPLENKYFETFGIKEKCHIII